MHYDIFISYRRSSYESANLIATRLKAAGYRVFFDLETMRSGLFNEQIYTVIEECKDVVAVLPPGALERCTDSEDWVRKELVHSMEHKKNIVPVMLNGFEWPKPMPEGMENLCMYQSITASTEYFDLAMIRLEGYLQSRKYTNFRKKMSIAAIVLAAVLLIGVGAYALCKNLAKPVCREVTEYMTARVGEVDLLMEDNLQIKDVIKSHSQKNYSETINQLDLIRRNVDYQETNGKTAQLELSGWQQFLAGLYRANATTLGQFDNYVNSFYNDIRNDLDVFSEAISPTEATHPSVINSVLSNTEIFTYTVNALYYSYLQVINNFPSNSQEIYRSLAKKFMNMPKTGLGLQDKEYDILVEQEMTAAERLIGGMTQDVNKMQDELQDANTQLDAAYEKIRNQYRSFIERNKIDTTEEWWPNWCKICAVAGFMESICQEQTEDDPIKPSTVLTDLETMLEDYVNAFPESAAYAIPANELYRDAAAGKRPLSGVIIYAFASGHSHDVYRIGDIIVSWNGKPVATMEELKKAYQSNPSNSGKVSLLRLENGILVQKTIDIPGNEDIIGFMNLKVGE